jgi:hypothetical protein
MPTLFWCKVLVILVRTGCANPARLLRPLALPCAIIRSSIVLAVPVLLATRLVGTLLLLLWLFSLARISLALVHTNLLDRVFVNGLRRTLLNRDVACVELAKLLVHLVIVERIRQHRFIV